MARIAIQPTDELVPQLAARGESASQPKPWTYDSLRTAVQRQPLPCMLVDLDRFDANVRSFAQRAAAHGKSIRIASKSLRVPALLQRACSVGGPTMRGVMCFSTREAVYLANCGFDDLLVAYPTAEADEIAVVGSASRIGKNITLTIDSCDHVRLLASRWQELKVPGPLRVCMDVDVSWRPLGIHIGAQRSPIRTLADFERLLAEVLLHPQLQFVGVMAYEAQLAGVPDASPFTPLRNVAIRAMKRFSQPDVMEQRRELNAVLKRRVPMLQFFNGGGTGSFDAAITEPWLTEVTVGSGLLQSHLFDYYAGQTREPALCFALPVTRCPQADRVTCHSGGFIASGTPGADRSPLPIFPAGLRVDPREGFGEVQTPLIVPSELRGRIQIGDPVFFRPAKAGEIAERFATYCLMKAGQIIDQVPTYRGLGQCFF